MPRTSKVMRNKIQILLVSKKFKWYENGLNESGSYSGVLSSYSSSSSTTSYSKSWSLFSMVFPNVNAFVPIVVKGISPNARAVLISLAIFLCALALMPVCARGQEKKEDSIIMWISKTYKQSKIIQFETCFLLTRIPASVMNCARNRTFCPTKTKFIGVSTKRKTKAHRWKLYTDQQKASLLQKHI